MDSSRSFQPSRRRKRATLLSTVLVVAATCAAALARTVSDVPTLSSQDGAGMADLGVIPASMSCAQLAETTSVAGQKIQIVEHQTASASADSPQYCAVTLSGRRQCRRRLELRAQGQPGAPSARALARKVQHRDDLVRQPGPGLPGDDVVGLCEAACLTG